MQKPLSSIEAEQAVLGAILFDASCYELALALQASDFAIPEHCEIFNWIRSDIDEGRKPTALSINHALSGMQIGQISGPTYIARLASCGDRTTARESVRIIKDMAARRQFMGIAETLKELAGLPDAKPDQIAVEAITALSEVIGSTRKKNSRPEAVGDIARKLVADLGTISETRLISTGLTSLDNFMGGWPRGELSIVAARPSMGKSAVLSAIARRGTKKGLNFLFFSLEMPKDTMVARMLSDFCYSRDEIYKIEYKDIIRKKLNQVQIGRLASAIEPFENYSITVDDQRGLTMAEIHMRAQRHADELDRKGKRLDVVMVDHIGKIRASDRYKGSMVHETGEKSDALMTSAYELDVAMIAAHQLNRNTEGREDKRPEQGDLRDTGNLEQDANTLIFPFRQVYYLENKKYDDIDKEKIRLEMVEKKKNSMEILVAKSRNGSRGIVELFVDMGSNHVSDMSTLHRSSSGTVRSWDAA
jgi:replicative DNA helicase